MTGDYYAVRLVNDALYILDPVTGIDIPIGTFGPLLTGVRGAELIEGYGPTIARTMSFGVGCGSVFAATQSKPRLLST